MVLQEIFKAEIIFNRIIIQYLIEKSKHNIKFIFKVVIFSERVTRLQFESIKLIIKEREFL